MIYSILIAEDDQTLNKFLVEYMQLHFKNVYNAFDGEEALNLYKLHKPNLIITDINMPKINGLKLVEQIRQNDLKTNIVILSAYTEKEKLLKAIELKLIRYLIKPVKPIELKQIIVDLKKENKQKEIIEISKTFSFNLKTNILLENNIEVMLTIQEKRLLKLLLITPNKCVTYENISEAIYEIESFSLNSIFSLVKRLRKKLPKDTIYTCFQEGYKIVKN